MLCSLPFFTYFSQLRKVEEAKKDALAVADNPQETQLELEFNDVIDLSCFFLRMNTNFFTV